MTRAAAFVVPLAVMMSLACGHTQPRVVPLIEAAGIPVTLTPARDVPLEVVTRSTSIPDPLPVIDSDVAFLDVERALGHATSSAVAEWAAHTPVKRDGGYQLFVEIMSARASFDDARLIVAFDVRATLHARVGGEYVAQKHVHCEQGALTPPERGAPVVYSCMAQIGRDLSSWLGRLSL